MSLKTVQIFIFNQYYQQSKSNCRIPKDSHPLLFSFSAYLLLVSFVVTLHLLCPVLPLLKLDGLQFILCVNVSHHLVSPSSKTLCFCDHLFRCICVLIMCLSCFSCCQLLSCVCVCSCARAYYCVCVCHVTAGQPIRKTPTCSGRTAVQWELISGFGVNDTYRLYSCSSTFQDALAWRNTEGGVRNRRFQFRKKLYLT